MKTFATVFITAAKHLWSNPGNVVVLTVFPIVLILLLGNALSAYISPETEFDPAPIGLVTDNEEGALTEFLTSEETMRFLETMLMTEKEANLQLSEGEIILFVSENDSEISVTKTNASNQESSIALAVMDAYRKISAAAETAMENGANPAEILAGIEAEFSVTDMPIGGRVPSATDYYTVTMIVYFLLIAGQNGVELFGKSLLGEMGGRIMTAPVSKPALVGGLIGAATVTSYVQGMMTFLFTAFVYGVYWGERIPLVLVTLFAVVLLSQAMAIFLVMLFKSPGPANGVITAFFGLTTFVSKGYAKTSFGSAEKVFAYAPNALAQTTIFGAIYGGNEAKMMEGLLILFIVAAVFFVGAFLLGRRRFA